jgi:hypothetical protein
LCIGRAWCIEDNEARRALLATVDRVLRFILAKPSRLAEESGMSSNQRIVKRKSLLRERRLEV